MDNKQYRKKNKRDKLNYNPYKDTIIKRKYFGRVLGKIKLFS